jgi:anti-sigma factor RsiW
MNCSFTEKISLLIDGELSREEENRARKHLSECSVCQKAQEDFLLMREQIKSFEPERDVIAERQSLELILASRKTRWWTKQIKIPAPAFALILTAMLALIAWAALAAGRPQPGETLSKTKHPIESAPSQPDQMADDLSRYDRGARAVIYKARRQQQGATTK